MTDWTANPVRLVKSNFKKMSLRRKILFKDGMLLISLLLMIAACLWGFFQQRLHVHASLNELAAIQQVEQAQFHLQTFAQSVSAGRFTELKAIEDLHIASLQMRQYKATVTQYNSVLPAEITPDLQTNVKSQTRRIVTELVQLAADGQPSLARPGLCSHGD